MGHPHLLGDLTIGYQQLRSCRTIRQNCRWAHSVLQPTIFLRLLLPRIANLLRGLFYTGLTIQAFPNQASSSGLLKRLVAESVDSTRRPYSDVSNQ